MWRIYIKNHPQFGPVYERVNTQPSWITKLALSVALIIFFIPLAVLFLAALLVGTVVFVVLALVVRVITVIQNLFSPERSQTSAEQGRENVRVIDRD